MSEITAWLEKLGLDEYIPTFTENDIDFEVLPKLTEQHLTKLGVSLGHQIKLLEAIAALEGNRPNVAQMVLSGEALVTPATNPPQAERRQLTVMFVDLVGSTALSGQLDPEDLSVIMRRYLNTVACEINRLEGFVAKFMGDGVLAYFGWPRAHEDEAERAVRAGLSIIAEVAKLKTPDDQALAARIGIATGLVVVGDLIGEGTAQEKTVVGETPNIAARLEALAELGTIVISGSTRQLCGEVFELEPLGEQQLKGVAAGVETFRVCGERTTDSRYQAQRTGAVLPLTGRQHELALIMERWRLACRGEGQMILLSGDAGIGKSRIVRALGDALEDETYYKIIYQCSPYHNDSALYPAIQQLTRAAGFAAVDNTETKLDKLEALLGRGRSRLTLAEPREHAPLIAALLNINSETRYGTFDFTPQQQRARTLQALIEQVTGLARCRPVLFVIEDAHWIDPTTLALVERVLDALSRSRVVLLITARPNFEHRFGGHPIMTRVVLNPLGRESSIAIVERLSSGKALPKELLDEILRKTDGVPLFVEELTKAVLESGQLRETATAYVLDVPLGDIDVPSSLHDSLMARLDRLQPVREVAQMAACIGHEFSYRLLSAVAGLADQELQAALVQLSEAELIFQRGTPPESSYLFKHALVQDVAYASLLRSRRQQLHSDIAEALEDEYFAEQMDMRPELLAIHYTRAGLAETALEIWQAAAQMAMKRSAYVEALSHLDQALTQLEKLPEGESRERRELQLLLMKFTPLVPTKGYAAPETDQASMRALELCRRISDVKKRVYDVKKHGDELKLHEVLQTRWAVNYAMCRHQESLRLAGEYLQRVLADDYDPVWLVVGYRNRAAALTMTGDIGAACQSGQEALQRFYEELWRPANPRLQVPALCSLALAEALAGRADTARAHGEEAICYARRASNISTLAYALFQAGVWLPSILRQFDTLQRYAEELFELAREHDVAFWAALSAPIFAALMARDALATERALTFFQHTFNSKLSVPQVLCHCVEIYLETAEIDAAQKRLAEADDLIRQHSEVYWEPEVYRLRGQLESLRGESHTADAVEQYQLAINRAGEQGSKLLQLRAATDLGRLRADHGERNRAYDLLSPIYAEFTEGFDIADLKEAKALLDEFA